MADDRILWLQNVFIKELIAWKVNKLVFLRNNIMFSQCCMHVCVIPLSIFHTVLLQKNVEANHKGETKRLLAKPTLEGLVFTTRNFILLTERLLKKIDCVCLHSFSQDVLEAFFGNLVSLAILQKLILEI